MIPKDTINSSEIIEFYKNKSIFITGATGFLGKALIEKLLRSCNEIKSIYVLIRVKKGKSSQERLNEIINCKVIFFYFFFLITKRQINIYNLVI
jgi:FlaA1/EpsC-like NDP-sugar epimerase